jgi:hypothetical protein
MQDAIEFERLLNHEGLWEALRFLNMRIPYRFTGVYRYEGTMLRNVVLFDQNDPAVKHGDDFPMIDAPCARVGDHGGQLVVVDFVTDPRFLRSFAPIVSYCGALIRNLDGSDFGTICHFDIKPCQTSLTHAALLKRVAPAVSSALQSGA